jgi:uncharacterized membrane protein YgcG
VAALAGCTTPELSTQVSAIRGGSVESGDPAVAALSAFGVYSYCTATLISHHTLLTAGHCDLEDDGVDMEAEFGADADDAAQSIAITRVKTHPMYTDEGKPYDLALMKLDADPVGIAPLPLNGAPLTAADVGRAIRHVGFGATDDSSDGVGIKRAVSYSLNRVEGMLIYSGAPGKQSCDGDSGGPGLMMAGAQGTEAIVGVVSDGPDCELSEDGWDDRIDLVKDWILQTVSAWDAPPTFVTVAGGGNGSGAGGGGMGGGGNGGGGDSGDGGGTAGSGPGTAVAGCAAAPGAFGGPGLALLALVWLRRRRPRP